MSSSNSKPAPSSPLAQLRAAERALALEVVRSANTVGIVGTTVIEAVLARHRMARDAALERISTAMEEVQGMAREVTDAFLATARAIAGDVAANVEPDLPELMEPPGGAQVQTPAQLPGPRTDGNQAAAQRSMVPRKGARATPRRTRTPESGRTSINHKQRHCGEPAPPWRFLLPASEAVGRDHLTEVRGVHCPGMRSESGRYALGAVHVRADMADQFWLEATNGKLLAVVRGPLRELELPAVAVEEAQADFLMGVKDWQQVFKAIDLKDRRRGLYWPGGRRTPGPRQHRQRRAPVHAAAGPFPDVFQVLPKKASPCSIIVDPWLLMDLLKIAIGVGDSREGARVVLHFYGADQPLAVTALNPENGSTLDSILMPLT